MMISLGLHEELNDRRNLNNEAKSPAECPRSRLPNLTRLSDFVWEAALIKPKTGTGLSLFRSFDETLTFPVEKWVTLLTDIEDSCLMCLSQCSVLF